MATLYVLQGPDKGYTIQVMDDVTILGRHSDQVALSDHTISRRHSRLEHSEGVWRIVDLGSSNGTYVNGERIPGAAELKHGDQIKIGSTLMVFGGRTRRRRNRDALTARQLMNTQSSGSAIDSSILSAVQSNEDSVILAAPETAEAVHAWHLMYQLAEAIGSISAESDLLERITDIILAHMTAEHVLILLRRDSSDEMEPVVMRDVARPGESPARIMTSSTIINHVLTTREGVLCANAMNDPRFSGNDKASSLQNLGLRSVICVPIPVRDEVRGIIHLDCLMSRHTYTHDQLRLATAVGRMCGMAAENQRMARERVHRERLAAVGETVAYLSHHIRNLLQGLRSGTDIVELGLKKTDPAKIRTGWRIVQNNLDRIHHLTTNMLTFSKDREPRIELTQINAIVEDAVALAQRPADDRAIMLLADLADDLPAVPADPEGIHQAVYNLILNAIGACEDETGRVVVKTSFDSAAQTVRITVRDNGPGISDQVQGQLFQPFHSSKGQGGTGLGLAAAKKIIDEMHGEISVKSRLGEGAKFTITLRLEGIEPADSEKTHGPPG